LLGIVFSEWQAKSSRANTVQGLESAMDQVGDVGEIPFKQFQAIKEGNASEEIDESGAILKLYHNRWNGVFKTYDLRLLVNEENMVIAFDEKAEGKAVGGISPISKKNLQALVKQNKKGTPEKPVEEKQVNPKEEAIGDSSKK
jgi:hypothetical protein